MHSTKRGAGFTRRPNGGSFTGADFARSMPIGGGGSTGGRKCAGGGFAGLAAPPGAAKYAGGGFAGLAAPPGKARGDAVSPSVRCMSIGGGGRMEAHKYAGASFAGLVAPPGKASGEASLFGSSSRRLAIGDAEAARGR